MNIFYLDPDPQICAQYHNDKHVVKMILESAQLLSTAHRVLDGVKVNKRYVISDRRESGLYKATHINHPSAIWVRQSIKNYEWLTMLFEQLLREYTYRYGKRHKCETMFDLAAAPNNISDGVFTGPTPAMPDYCKVPGDSLQSYRNYYILEKSHIASWKKRSVPHWYNEMEVSK